MKKIIRKNVAGLITQFMAQPSKYAQKMFAIGKPRDYHYGEKQASAIVEHVPGIGMDKSCQHSPKEIRKRRYAIANNLASLVADNVKYGVLHGDLHGGNVILKTGKRGGESKQ